MTVSEQAKKMAIENDLSEEINQVYIDVVGTEYATSEQVQEAYSGEFSNDEEFAENIANELGLIDQKVSWPYTCIDWERASRDLMYDYTEQDGYYFRNL